MTKYNLKTIKLEPNSISQKGGTLNFTHEVPRGLIKKSQNRNYNLKTVHRWSTVFKCVNNVHPPNWKYQVVKNEATSFIITKCWSKYHNVNKDIIKNK